MSIFRYILLLINVFKIHELKRQKVRPLDSRALSHTTYDSKVKLFESENQSNLLTRSILTIEII